MCFLSIFASKSYIVPQLSENVTKPPICPSGGRKQVTKSASFFFFFKICILTVHTELIHRSTEFFFFLRDGRMIRLWAIVLQKTECLCISGRAGARVQQGRAPERNFEESYKKEAGASSGPTLNLSASAGGN